MRVEPLQDSGQSIVKDEYARVNVSFAQGSEVAAALGNKSFVGCGPIVNDSNATPHRRAETIMGRNGDHSVIIPMCARW